MVLTAANTHIAEVFCIVQHADQCWCGECSCGNTGLGRGAACFCEPHERGVRCEVSTLNPQRSTAVDCGIISADNRAQAGNGELHAGRNGDCRGIAGVERMSVQLSVTPRTTFGGVTVTLSVVSVSNVTVLFFIDVWPIASCTLI